MFTIVLVFHLFVVLAMIVVILIQRSEGAGFSSINNSISTSRGVSDFLTRSTSILAVIFFINSICLSIIVRDFSYKENLILENDNSTVKISSDCANVADDINFDSKNLEGDFFLDDNYQDFIPKVEIPMDFN